MLALHMIITIGIILHVLVWLWMLSTFEKPRPMVYEIIAVHFTLILAMLWPALPPQLLYGLILFSVGVIYSDGIVACIVGLISGFYSELLIQGLTLVCCVFFEWLEMGVTWLAGHLINDIQTVFCSLSHLVTTNVLLAFFIVSILAAVVWYNKRDFQQPVTPENHARYPQSRYREAQGPHTAQTHVTPIPTVQAVPVDDNASLDLITVTATPC